jgi:hypothetical protein
MTRYPRAVYILIRLGSSTLSVVSRFANATIFGGSTYQSLSARAWIDGQTDPVWLRRRRRIDAGFRLIFGQEDHCETYYLAEVAEAQKTLLRAGFVVSLDRQASLIS